MRLSLLLTIQLILVFSCNNPVDTRKDVGNGKTVPEEVHQVVEGVTNNDTILFKPDLWSPSSYDPKPRLYITAHFSECGEWGGHYEKLTISLDKSHEPYLEYDRYMVKCDSVNPLNLFPYQILDYTKHLKLSSKDKESIENYISRLTRSKIIERYPGHAGNEFHIVNHDSTLLLIVYDNKQEDVYSYSQLLNELRINTSQ